MAKKRSIHYVVYDPNGPSYHLVVARSQKSAISTYIREEMLDEDPLNSHLGQPTAKTWEQHMRDVVKETRARMKKDAASCPYKSCVMEEYVGPAL